MPCKQWALTHSLSMLQLCPSGFFGAAGATGGRLEPAPADGSLDMFPRSARVLASGLAWPVITGVMSLWLTFAASGTGLLAMREPLSQGLLVSPQTAAKLPPVSFDRVSNVHACTQTASQKQVESAFRI
jgi:hypothetical protein